MHAYMQAYIHTYTHECVYESFTIWADSVSHKNHRQRPQQQAQETSFRMVGQGSQSNSPNNTDLPLAASQRLKVKAPISEVTTYLGRMI